MPESSDSPTSEKADIDPQSKEPLHRFRPKVSNPSEEYYKRQRIKRAIASNQPIDPNDLSGDFESLEYQRRISEEMDRKATENEHAPSATEPQIPIVSASQRRAWEEDQARESQAVHSARMAKLLGLVTRSRTVALETGHYLMGWNPVGILIGLFGAGGALMLTLALIPETYSPSLYRLAEILFAVSILLFIAKCIYDFRAHEERRLIARGLGVLGVFILIGVIGLFEWNRPTKTPALQIAQPTLGVPAVSPTPTPTPAPAIQSLPSPASASLPTPSPVRVSSPKTKRRVKHTKPCRWEDTLLGRC